VNKTILNEDTLRPSTLCVAASLSLIGWALLAGFAYGLALMLS
jgi:hypothetical protein